MVAFAFKSPEIVGEEIVVRMKNPNYDYKVDTMLLNFAKIGSMLSSENQCIAYLAKLNDDLIAYAKQINVFDKMVKNGDGPPTQLAPVSNLKGAPQSVSVAFGIDQRYPVAMVLERHEHFKVMSGFLNNFETKHGFNGGNGTEVMNKLEVPYNEGQAVKVPGFLPGPDFRSLLISRARHFKDPGTSAMHGEFTHRLQWYIICESAIKADTYTATPTAMFQACAAPHWCVGGNPKASMGVWDFLFEGGVPGTSDFRKAETFNEYLILASDKAHQYHSQLWFLSDLAMGRYAKRVFEKSQR